MARKYTRDNRGRFASAAGGGATARGGRLKTAAGNKRQGQTMKAAGGPKGTIGKGRNGPKPKTIALKPATTTRTKLKLSSSAGSGGTKRTAQISDRLKVNTAQNGPRQFSATVVDTKTGAPRMKRSGFRNISEAKAWAQRPSARGPRLMGGGLRTEAAPNATWMRTRVGAGRRSTIGKPKGLKPGAISGKLKPAAASRRRSAVGRIDAAKADRIVSRVDANRTGQRRAQGSARRSANALRTQERARAFLLAPAKRALKKGQSMQTNESVRRAVANAAKKPAAKAASKSATAPKVDYNGAVKQLNRQAAAIKRINSPQQTFNGNTNYARQIDLRTAKSSPMQNAARSIRAAKGDLRRAQARAKNPLASAEMRTRSLREIPKLRNQVVSAVRIARAFKPANASETKRRYQASKMR